VAAGLVDPGQDVGRQDVERFFQTAIKVRLVDLATGQLVTEGAESARDYDQRAARNDPTASRPAPKNRAGIARLPKRGVVYLVTGGEGVEQAVIPVEGLGMWGTIYGFVSLDRDGNTIRGLTFYEQRETPGLGGEISNPEWLALWQGRESYDDQWVPQITVVKGTAGPPRTDPHKVDGLSGATVTSNAVTRLIQFWLSESGYGAFLKRFREGATT